MCKFQLDTQIAIGDVGLDLQLSNCSSSLLSRGSRPDPPQQPGEPWVTSAPFLPDLITWLLASFIPLA